MSFLSKRIMIGIVSAVLGISIMISTFVFASQTSQTQEETLTADVESDSKELVATPEEEESPFLNKCMAANVEQYVNIHVAADESSEVIGKLYIGAVADVLQKDTAWTHISSGTVTGYISNQYLVYDEDAELMAYYVCGWVATVNVDQLRVRKEPNTECDTWGIVGTGERHDVILQENGWVAISYDGEIGYLSEEYLTLEQNIGTAISIAEELAAIQAEQERLAAIAAAEAAAEAERQAKIQAGIAAAQFVTAVQTSPYNVSEEEAYLLACLVDCEAGYESFEGKLAVANIVLNRLNGGAYGSTISSVIYAPSQFSVVGATLNNKMAAGPRGESIEATKQALSGYNNVPEFTNFCSYKIANYNSFASYIQIGAHVFYRRV